LQVVERVKLQALLQEMNLGTSGLVDQKTAPKVGKLLKSKHVTTGSLADLEKENLQIVSVVVDVDKMGSIDTQEVQGTLKEFYDLEKIIACSIIEDLGRDCRKMPGAFGKVHTKSLAALTAYSVGLDYLDQEKYDEAREEFQKAIDEDPEFDLAKETLDSTPLTAMLFMNPSQIVSTLSVSAASSAAIGTVAAGTAVAGGGGVGIVGITTGVILGAAAIGAAVAGSSGGDGDDPIPPPGPSEPNLTGVWAGTWNDANGPDSGNISLTLTQINTTVSGTVSITGSECISTGTLSGSVSGSSLSAQIVSGSDIASFRANCTSTSMNGTLQVTSGPCAGDTGNVSITATTNATIKWPYN
ncbi:CsgG/HfaB family protein, partial [Thermodesulfobacteriota bacterium]